MDWSNVAPGEYEVGLTVTNNVDMTDSTTIRVYVSYAGYWADFEIGGNNTTQRNWSSTPSFTTTKRRATPSSRPKLSWSTPKKTATARTFRRQQLQG